jgi:hypothetical protein
MQPGFTEENLIVILIVVPGWVWDWVWVWYGDDHVHDVHSINAGMGTYST